MNDTGQDGKKDELIRFLRDDAGRPVSFKDIVAAFGVTRRDKDRLKRLIGDLIAEGSIVKTRSGTYALPAKMNLVTGEIICHPDGFGFVSPLKSDKNDKEDDIFINPRKLGGAMHGDTVVARVEGYKDRGRREGSVIRIVKRGTKSVVGRIDLTRGVGIVTPADERILDKIIVPPKETGGAKSGDMVSVELTRWPERYASASGRVVEVIGAPNDPKVEAEIILRKYGLPHSFALDVLREVEKIPPSVTDKDIMGRVDLRDKAVFTIDGETAKDFDDAVSIERTVAGFKLRVSIADVSHYVDENSAIDAEAFARGTSVYFPDRCTPMLPEALSNGICSLNPEVDRLTVTAEIDFDSAGNVTRKRFYDSVIRSCERLTYTIVAALLTESDDELKRRYAPILPDLKIMEALAELLSKKRREAGSIDFDLPEPQIIIDISGRVEDIVRSERNVAHRLIEEFMLAANKAVAQEFATRSLPFLYRIHDEPDEESINDFAEFIGAFGIHFKAQGPKSFQKVLTNVEGTPEERLVNHVLLRSMRQAAYSEVNIGHFGLAFDDYCHFTSPIRRYPDLIVHRLLKKLNRGTYTQDLKARMEAYLPMAAKHTSERERKAMEAEREIVDLKKAQFMKDKEGSRFEGFISGVTSFGFFVELKEFFVEGLVRLSSLYDDFYNFDEKRHVLTGERTKRRFRLGDDIAIKIARVDLERRRIDMVLADEGATPVSGAGKLRVGQRAAAKKRGPAAAKVATGIKAKIRRGAKKRR